MFVAPAQAVALNFVLTGDYSASWSLDSNPSPDVDSSGEGFIVWDVSGNFPGASEGLADLTFYNSAIDGGLGILDFYGNVLLLSTDGPQLYSGDESSPTFLTGSFNLTEFDGIGTYTLTVTDATGAVPEPAAWALMLGGFGLVGSAMRRRQRVVVTFQRT